MNLPNRLTMIRLFLVPIFILVMLVPGMGNSFGFLGTTITIKELLSFIIFAAASITDFFDGKIARSRNLVTTFGKFVDPVADKLLVNSALILLTYLGKMPVLCLLIMVGRDTIVDAVRNVAASQNVVVAASMLGKAKTMTQMIGICLLLLNNPIFAMFNIRLDLIMIILATIISAVSGIDYFMKNRSFILESM